MSTAAWADGEIAFTAGNRIGATDNSTAWYGQASEVVAIGPHQRLTLKFKTYTNDDAEGWNDQMTHALNIWDGQEQNLYMKGCGWGWKTHSGSVEDPVDYNVNTSGVFNQKTYGWADEYRTMIGTGADVVMYVERNGSELSISQTFTTSGGAKYNHYFSGTFGLENGNVWLQMTVERAHVDITADKEFTNTSISGKLIGLMNNTTAFWTAWSDYFTLEPNQSLTLRYKCYSNRINNYNGGAPYVTTDADRGAAGYTEYFGLRPDNWVNVAGVNATSCNYGDVLSWDWATFREKVDGSTVTVTITRSGANVTVREEFAPADASTTLYEEYTQVCGDGTQNIRVFLTAEGAHLDLLPVTFNMNAYGWATFASDYPLDFANATPAGLTAYRVAGRTGTAIDKESVDVAPAGTPLLLNGTVNTTYSIPVATSASAVGGNLLVRGEGAAVGYATGYTRYVLGVAESKAVFLKLVESGDEATVSTDKAYLQFAGNVPAHELTFDFDSETTAISELTNTNLTNYTNEYFNLAGQRVANPTKGLYIVNGKKVVVK